MAQAVSLYPPTPENVPFDLTKPTHRYQNQMVLVLLTLLLFVLIYVGLVVATGVLTYLCVVYVGGVSKAGILLKLGCVAVCGSVFLFLLKGLFKRQHKDRTPFVEIKERDQPHVYDFIGRLCDETEAPFPKKIYVSPEVNACVFYDSSLLSLLLPAQKNLLIGLGLINMLTLDQFKAVLAHEFGHFSQKSMKLGAYVVVANQVIGDMVYGRDWFDELLLHWRNTDIRIGWAGWALYGVVWALRMLLAGLFRVVNFADRALSRQMEFNADLVAVSVTGSDSLIHALVRLEFAGESLEQTFSDLAAAGDHEIYSWDLFYHQAHAAAHVKKLQKDDLLGEPPLLPRNARLPSQVFKPDDEEVPSMWATHPRNYDREVNAKKHYFRSPLDTRSPWLLFDDADALRQKVTRKFYSVELKVDKKIPLADPRTVQEFIDREHKETTYDARYCGLYDGRFIEPGDVERLPAEALQLGWARGQVASQHAALYGADLKDRMAKHVERQGEYDFLFAVDNGDVTINEREFEFRDRYYHRAEVPRLLKKVDKELEEDRQQMATLDRKVLLVHYLQARELGPNVVADLLNRYRFQIRLQALIRELSAKERDVTTVLDFLSNAEQVGADQFKEVMGLFRKARRALRDAIDQAKEMPLPALENLKPGTPLNAFLLDEDLVYALRVDDERITGKWIKKFLRQFGAVIQKARRVHFKSLGALLATQERIAADWGNLENAPEVLPAE